MSQCASESSARFCSAAWEGLFCSTALWVSVDRWAPTVSAARRKAHYRIVVHATEATHEYYYYHNSMGSDDSRPWAVVVGYK